jgi:TetR/AcrR family transcriptional regulator, transcriptional repressor for nem operon
MNNMDTKAKLLETAAALAQTRGFNGFSFHDLADANNIRTASIHYHFPTKLDLGQALIKRYTEEFEAALGYVDEGKPEERLKHYVGLFRRTLVKKRMCLCGMIGAEAAGLPREMGAAVQAFFDLNEKWLTLLFQRMDLTKSEAQSRALLTFAGLEGAMILARNGENLDAFDKVAKAIVRL